MSNIESRGPRALGFFSGGGGNVLAGLAILFVNYLVAQFSWLFIILGLGMLAGGFYLAVHAANRLLAFLLMVGGLVLVLRNLVLLGDILNILLTLVAVVLIVVGLWSLVRQARS